MTMTPQQAAEVLRNYKAYRSIHHPTHDEFKSALETAIAVMEAKPAQSESALIEKYTERILIDYPESDKIHIDLWEFASEMRHESTIPIWDTTQSHPATPPTDEQIGEVFEEHWDGWKAHEDAQTMTRTAFIKAVRECMTLCNSK